MGGEAAYPQDLEVDCYALALPIAEASGFGTGGAALLGGARGGFLLGRMPGRGFFQRTSGGGGEFLAGGGVGREIIAHAADLRARRASRQPAASSSPLL